MLLMGFTSGVSLVYSISNLFEIAFLDEDLLFKPFELEEVKPIIDIQSFTYFDMINEFEYDSIYNDYIYKKSVEYGIPYLIVNRLLYNESRFNPNAVGLNSNGTKDYGLAQVNNKYINHFKEKYFDFDPFDPYQSIDFCVHHLRILYNATEDWYTAVAAYNAGLGRISTGSIPKNTITYCNLILKDIEFLL